jgi:hypothetical protein
LSQFEYQQAQLEKEIEELSWKVERAESTDRAVCINCTVEYEYVYFTGFGSTNARGQTKTVDSTAGFL